MCVSDWSSDVCSSDLLDRAFDRLGARSGQEDRVGKGVLDEPRREGFALRAAIKVRHMDQRRYLFLDRLGQMRMAVPEQIDRDAACEIQITLASIADQIGALKIGRAHV